MRSQITARNMETGVYSYDAAVFRGDTVPNHTNIYSSAGMASLLQRGGPDRPGQTEISVPAVDVSVLLTRLGGSCTQPARIAGRPVSLQTVPGMHVFLPSRTDSWWACDQRTLDGWFHLHFDSELVAAALDEYGVAFDQILTCHNDGLAALVDVAKSLTDGADPPAPLVWDSLATVVLHRIAQLMDQHRRGPAPGSGLAAWQTRRIVDFVAAHFADPVTLADLANLVDLSPFHFARAFKLSVGVPPHRYQSIVRMEHARGLLANPELSIDDIARAVGYASTSSFARAFRKETGDNPVAFRRRCRA